MSSAASVIAALCTTSRGVAPACCKRANRPAIGQAASSQSLVWPCRKKVTPDSAPARRCRSSHSGSGCPRVLVSGPSTRKTSGRSSRARRVVTSASPPGRSSRCSVKLRSGRSTQDGQPQLHSWGQLSRSDARATHSENQSGSARRVTRPAPPAARSCRKMDTRASPAGPVEVPRARPISRTSVPRRSANASRRAAATAKPAARLAPTGKL